MNLEEEFHNRRNNILRQGLEEPTRIFISRNLLYEYIKIKRGLYPYQLAILGQQNMIFGLPFFTIVEDGIFELL